MKVQFKEWKCVVNSGYYQEGHRKAIELIEEETGEPIATATVNLPNYPLAENEIFVKNYSENEGMVLALAKAGIIEGYPLTHVKLEHVKISSYKLTKEALEKLW